MVRESLMTPNGLHEALLQTLPGLRDFSRESIMEGRGIDRWEEVNLHAILHDFCYSFAHYDADESQISQLARIIEISLSARDNLENAWMTSFLEAGVSKRLWSHLSREAKVYIKTN